MSAGSELQIAIYAALVADAGVGALVSDRIYDHVPQAVTFPYVSFGPSDAVTDDAEQIDGQEHAVQVDVWSRSGGKKVNKDIVWAVRAALHEADLTMADPYALHSIRVLRTRVMDDPDGETVHGILDVRALVEG